MSNPKCNTDLLEAYFSKLDRRYHYQLNYGERKQELRRLWAMTGQDHQLLIDALELKDRFPRYERNVVDYFAEVAKRHDLKGKEDQIRQSAIEAKMLQRDWWQMFGSAWHEGFCSEREIGRLAKSNRTFLTSIKRPEVINRLVCSGSSDGDLQVRREQLTRCFDALAALQSLFEDIPATRLHLGNSRRCDLRLMVLPAQAFWQVHHSTRRERSDRLDERSVTFICDVLWLIDRTVLESALKKFREPSPEMLHFGLRDLDIRFHQYWTQFQVV